jgi:hypothetical protein
MKYQYDAENKPYLQYLGIGNMAINGLIDSLASGGDCWKNSCMEMNARNFSVKLAIYAPVDTPFR